MPNPPTDIQLTILGLGNELLTDDGVGIHAIRELAQCPPPRAELVEVGTRALDALGLLERSDAVIAIDAVMAEGTPGSVYRFDVQEAQETRGPTSPHSIGIVEALRLLPESSRPRVTVIGVEPERMDVGMELSPRVREALPRVIELATAVARQLSTAGAERTLR
jgi:hydrogenase maturation protease